ncbi:hypothetical protein [Kitasatospora cheerisanensis]|uniref:hypothetical protein n=1 Tax=Kitasatospora cheerisanensis TaxID=81942 RepID=UPI0012EE2B64
MRTHWSPIVGAAEPPGLLLLSTDGLSKSFAEPSGFDGFAAGLYQRLRDDGHAAVVEQLGGWLERAASFSGDDTSVALAWHDPHRPAAREPRPPPDGAHRRTRTPPRRNRHEQRDARSPPSCAPRTAMPSRWSNCSARAARARCTGPAPAVASTR